MFPLIVPEPLSIPVPVTWWVDPDGKTTIIWEEDVNAFLNEPLIPAPSKFGSDPFTIVW
jgi:hypothetical protein